MDSSTVRSQYSVYRVRKKIKKIKEILRTY